ncbi:MAG: hypothetical protein IJ438_08440 [Clostridia bacterium]|nr:hypothetical protein [Clostridia bacterium]
MIVNTGMAPLFWYIYRPGRSASAEDGGFNVALYGNNTLTYRKFNSLGQIVDDCTFQLPPEVMGRYMMILESQSWWMGKVPLNIKTDGKPQYSCMFGFAGHPMFICDEINTLVLAPFNSQRGMYARRLRMMLESISEMLYSCGLGLTVESFVWNWQMIRPISPMNEHTAQMVQPTAEQMPMVDEDDYGMAAHM